MEALYILVLLCLALGAVVGVLAGMLGIGGGLVIVPVLLFMFKYLLDIGPDHAMPIAIATSLSTVIFTGLSSARTHFSLGNIDLSIVVYCAFGIAIGAVLGAYFATVISGLVLKRIFAVLVILIALQMIFGKNRQSTNTLNKPALSVVGLGSGIISALMGIGGGAILVPLLVWFQINMKKAIGCASLCTVVIASFGTMSFVVNGLDVENLPSYAFGYVYIPATIGIAVTSMITAPIGAKLTSKLDVKKLKRIFAFFLVLVSIRMIIGLE